MRVVNFLACDELPRRTTGCVLHAHKLRSTHSVDPHLFGQELFGQELLEEAVGGLQRAVELGRVVQGALAHDRTMRAASAWGPREGGRPHHLAMRAGQGGG